MSETLLAEAATVGGHTVPEGTPLGEGRMVREDCWRQVHRLFHVEQRSKAEIARQLGLDRKTVRGILQAEAWQPYTRAEPADTLLTAHTTNRSEDEGRSQEPHALRPRPEYFRTKPDDLKPPENLR